MSIIFGICAYAGEQVTESELRTLAASTGSYAPDGTFLSANGPVGAGFQPFHTHERSKLESQPAIDDRGNLLVLDGRLDNHADLTAELDLGGPSIPDSSVFLAAFARWGRESFSRFTGDWAAALWSATDRTLYLARDPAGTRTLYFQVAERMVRWSTYIESFFARRESYALDREYATHFLCGWPIGQLTPYLGVRGVPPAHSVAIRNDGVINIKRWDWVPKDPIRFGTDQDYEDHFFSLFQQSVDRRTGTGAPILAELSGGMDSTSIVCVSDHLRRQAGRNPDEQLDTISYWDPSEPNWDEKPYFEITEARRGKAGIHIEHRMDLRAYRQLNPDFVSPWPERDSIALEIEKKLETAVVGRGYRAILSGIGGDELLGGVPTPLPELADCLTAGGLLPFFRQSVKWCLASRGSLIQLLGKAIGFTASHYWTKHPAWPDRPLWIRVPPGNEDRASTEAFEIIESRWRSRPSLIAFALTWETLLDTLPHRVPAGAVRHELRYPYLDRDLVGYLASIPREQLVRPGRRRSLMRRALKNIVPVEILERRRKAYIARGPLVALERDASAIRQLLQAPALADLGLVEPRTLLEQFERAITGSELGASFAIQRALLLELWLQGNASQTDASRRRLRF